MELKGEYRIPAPREQVWAMLNDPDVLRECIPGCESLEGSPADGFSARVTTKIGPVKATFNGAVTLSNVNPPESYTISGEGKGGVAGFAKGGADVHLAEDGAGHGPDLHRQRAGRRQARAARLAADRFHREEARRPVLLLLSPRRPARAAPTRRSCRPAGPARRDRRADRRGPGRRSEPCRRSAAALTAVAVIAGRRRRIRTRSRKPRTRSRRRSRRRPPWASSAGPIVWGLLVILALLFVYVIRNVTAARAARRVSEGEELDVECDASP